jgi:hypothetical protein
MRIVPVNFKSETQCNVSVLQNDIGNRWWGFATNPDRFDKLITAIRTGVDNDGALDKGSTSFNQ